MLSLLLCALGALLGTATAAAALLAGAAVDASVTDCSQLAVGSIGGNGFSVSEWLTDGLHNRCLGRMDGSGKQPDFIGR